MLFRLESESNFNEVVAESLAYGLYDVQFVLLSQLAVHALVKLANFEPILLVHSCLVDQLFLLAQLFDVFFDHLEGLLKVGLLVIKGGDAVVAFIAELERQAALRAIEEEGLAISLPVLLQLFHRPHHVLTPTKLLVQLL